MKAAKALSKKLTLTGLGLKDEELLEIAGIRGLELTYLDIRDNKVLFSSTILEITNKQVKLKYLHQSVIGFDPINESLYPRALDIFKRTPIDIALESHDIMNDLVNDIDKCPCPVSITKLHHTQLEYIFSYNCLLLDYCMNLAQIDLSFCFEAEINNYVQKNC